MTEPYRAELVDLGTGDYRRVLDLQRELVAQRQSGARGDVILTVEHAHVITLGRRRDSMSNVLSAGDVPVIEIERGGDVTYHGPGQQVVYPILLLREGERDLHRYLRNLEEALIRTLHHFGIDAGREAGKTGAWSAGKKLASIGIACRRWVTFHGLALNVNTDLAYFQRINPCGFDAEVMTSMAAELGGELDLAVVREQLVADLASCLGREIVPGQLDGWPG